MEVERRETPAPVVYSSAIRAADEGVFDWAAYEDPGNILFWDDGGDFVPSRPLREYLANQTEENAERYRRWQREKMALTAQGHAKLYPSDAEKVGSLPWKDLDVIYFYATGCSICEAQKPFVQTLMRLGVRVYPVYLDSPAPELPGSVPYAGALMQYPVEGTPTWVVTLAGERREWTGKTDMARFVREATKLLWEEGE